MTSPVAFFIFSKFQFSRSLGGQKGKKWPKMMKNSVHLTPHHRNCIYTSYDCDFMEQWPSG